MKPKSNPFLRFALVAATAALAMGSAHAATYTWSGATDSLFTTGSNWVGDTWAQWNDYEFAGNPTTGSVNVDSGVGWGNITLSSGLTTDIVISGTNPIIMAPAKVGQTGWEVPSLGGTITIDTASKNLTVNTSFLIAGELVWNVGDGRTLTANGAVNWWSDQGGTTASLKKLGDGTVVLTAANNYQGGTTISAGTLQLSGSGTLGSGALSVKTGGTLDLGTTTQTLGGNLNASGAGNGAVGTITNGTIDLNGKNAFLQSGTFTMNLTGGGDSRLWIGGDAGATVELGGTNSSTYSDSNSTIIGFSTTGAAGTVKLLSATALGPNGQQTQVHSGTLDLNGQTGITVSQIALFNTSHLVNNNTGTAASFGGTVDLTGTTTHNIGGAGNMTLSGVLQSGGFTKSGAGTLTLSGTSSTYSGVTTIAAGVLNAATFANNGANSSLGNGTGDTVAEQIGLLFLGGTLQYTGSAAQSTDRQIRIGTSGGTIDASGTGSGTLSFTHSGANTNLFETAGTRTLTLTGSNTGNNTFAIILENQGANATSLTKSGAGTWVLTGSNTYTGTTTISAGTLSIGNWGASGLGTITVGNTASTTATLDVTGGTLNLGANHIFVGTGSAVGIVNQSGGAVSFASGNGLLIGNGATGTYNLSGGTLSGFASDGRGVMIGVNDSSNGTFNLSGSGNLSLASGELAVGRNDEATTGCTVAYNQTGGTATVGYLSIGGTSGSTTTNATFSLTGGTFSASTFQNLAASASSSATLTLGTSAQVTLPAFPTPAGTANLTFDFTSGSLSPSAASTSYMSGLTHAYLTANGARFNVDTGKDITIAQVLENAPSEAGKLTKLGTGTLTLSGASSYSGGTTINDGTVIATVQATPGSTSALGLALPASIITINSGGALTGSVDNWLDNTGLASGGTDAHAVVVNAGGTLSGASGKITGLGNVTLNGGTIEVINGLSFLQWNGSFTLGGDITVSGSAASSITTGSGSGASANMQMSDGANNVGGTRTFTVNDVTNNANSDLIVSARLANGTVIKAGTGTLELAAGIAGTGTPVNWRIDAGTLKTSTDNVVGPVNITGTVLGTTFDLGATTQAVGSLGATGAGNGYRGTITNGTINLDGNNAYLQSGTFTMNLTGSGNSRLWIGGDDAATVKLGGTNTSTYSDTNSTIIGLSSYTGTAGTVKLLSATALGPNSQQTQVHSGTLDLNGQTGITVSQIALNGTSNMVNNNTGAAASYAGTVDFYGVATPSIGGAGNITLSGVLQNGGFTKSGAGTLTLTATNTYTGLTTVSNGTLAFDVSETLLGGLNIATTGTAVLTAHSGGATSVKVLDITGLTISGTTAFVGGADKGGDISGFGGSPYSPAPVPEPGTTGLIGLGIFAMMALRRRPSK